MADNTPWNADRFRAKNAARKLARAQCPDRGRRIAARALRRTVGGRIDSFENKDNEALAYYGTTHEKKGSPRPEPSA